MNQEYKEKLSRKIENNYSTLEERIMQDIVRRIKKTGKITSTADWQINRLLILGNSSEDIENMLKETLDASYPEMFELYDKVIDWEYVRNKDIYEQINANFIPYEQNKELQQITDALLRQTKGELENITQTLGFYLDYGNGKKVLTPLAEVYQGYLDQACMDIASGTFSYNEVLRRTVTQLTNSGLRTIEFASGRAYRVNVAARMAVMTGISQLTGQISDMNAEKLGTEHFEVAWHGGARPEHAVWQGKVWSKEQLRTVCGLGTVTGLLGANCYHEYYPFFPGISERNWTDEWLEEQNRKENTPKEWHGKEYTTYEAKQKQRQMETAMRAQREKVKLLEEGDADPDEIMLARAKYQGQLDEYARFSRKMGLKQERERIYLDMQGRVAPNKKKSDTATMRVKNKIVNTDDSIASLEKQFSQLTEGYSYADFIKDFGSIEAGFEGASAEDIKKAKMISEQIEALRGKSVKMKNTKVIHTRQESVDIFKRMGIDIEADGISDEVLSKYADFINDFEITHPGFFGVKKKQLKKISVVDNIKGVNANGIFREKTSSIEIKSSTIRKKQSASLSRSDDFEVHGLSHEYGHYIADSLRKTYGISEADVVQNAINRYFDGDIFKSPKDLKDCLSSYGSTSYQEAFAEAFAEAYSCKEPRKFAKIFKEELEKVLTVENIGKNSTVDLGLQFSVKKHKTKKAPR